MAVLPEELKCPHCGFAIAVSDVTACGHCGREVSLLNDARPQADHDNLASQITDQMPRPEQIENGTISMEQAALQTTAATDATTSTDQRRGPRKYFNLIKNIVALPVFWFATQFGADYLSRCCGQAAESITTGVVMFMALVGWAFFVIVT